MTKHAFVCPTSDAIHDWFGLTYSNYLVLPRVLLQSMPVRWQRRFVKMLDDYHEAFRHVDDCREYMVVLRKDGRFIKETLPHYRHGYVEPRKKAAR